MFRFETSWEYTLTSELSLGRVQMEVASTEVLNTNVTSSLIELAELVRANWTADYYAPQVRNHIVHNKSDLAQQRVDRHASMAHPHPHPGLAMY